MKILSAQQTRDWDAYTIQHEPIRSIDLMERAAAAFVQYSLPLLPKKGKVLIFAGPGNNGGDALAIARLLMRQEEATLDIEVYALKIGAPSSDFQINAARLPLTLGMIAEEEPFPAIRKSDWVIDGLFGSGLSRPAGQLAGKLIEHINACTANIIAIDIASGLYGDTATPQGGAIIEPRHTIAFQAPVLAFMAAECERYTGHWHIADIRLLAEGIASTPSLHYYTTPSSLPPLLPRPKFGHKGTFGHALILAGSYGKLGAAYLAALATLRSGIGLLTTHLPKEGYQFMQLSLPEAMCSVDTDHYCLTNIPDIASFDAIGIGPGIGQAEVTKQALQVLLQVCKKQNKPLVVDADGINIIGANRYLLELLPPNIVFTPHPKEFERLVGKKAHHSFERWQQLQEFCQKWHATVILKGAHTAVGLPNGQVHFNSTGNPNMATAGSGDVLAGVITSLLAQGYDCAAASILGVYAHGLAGDIAHQQIGGNGLIASDIANAIPKAWGQIQYSNH